MQMFLCYMTNVTVGASFINFTIVLGWQWRTTHVTSNTYVLPDRRRVLWLQVRWTWLPWCLRSNHRVPRLHSLSIAITRSTINNNHVQRERQLRTRLSCTLRNMYIALRCTSVDFLPTFIYVYFIRTYVNRYYMPDGRMCSENLEDNL